ncbi:MAG TPA: hypothetical protein VI893_10670 [Thermoplasmata archaeon]|nr:hypothetical protein [Thermoplasmata archaeon]
MNRSKAILIVILLATSLSYLTVVGPFSPFSFDGGATYQPEGSRNLPYRQIATGHTGYYNPADGRDVVILANSQEEYVNGFWGRGTEPPSIPTVDWSSSSVVVVVRSNQQFGVDCKEQPCPSAGQSTIQITRVVQKASLLGISVAQMNRSIGQYVLEPQSISVPFDAVQIDKTNGTPSIFLLFDDSQNGHFRNRFILILALQSLTIVGSWYVLKRISKSARSVATTDFSPSSHGQVDIPDPLRRQ